MSAPNEDVRARHETRDIAVRPIVIAAGGLVVVVALVFAAMAGLFDYFAARQARLSPPANPLVAAEGPRLPPGPRLQAAPIRDLHELHAAEDVQLEGYAWIDRGAGVVRIPIDRAMELLAARPAGTGAPRP